MWAKSITGHSISQWLPCPVPSWVSNTIGTWGGNSVKFSQLNICKLGNFDNCLLCEPSYSRVTKSNGVWIFMIITFNIADKVCHTWCVLYVIHKQDA